MFKKISFLLPVVLCILLSVVHAQSFLKALTKGEYDPEQSFVKTGNTTFFTATDGINGFELWKTDGTKGGTVLVKDFTPGASGTYISSLFAFNGSVYIQLYSSLFGNGLWKSDGTSAGTIFLTSIDIPGYKRPSFSIFKNELYFINAINNTYSIWKTNGTTAGTLKVSKDYTGEITALAPVGNNLYFNYNNFIVKTDGTSNTQKQITISENYTSVSEMAACNGKLAFINTNGLYILDPVDDKPVLLKSQSTSPGAPVCNGIYSSVNGFLFSFSGGSTDELWQSNGTPAGTKLFKTIANNNGGGRKIYTLYKNKLYFTAIGNYSSRLWFTDGTTAGTNFIDNYYLPPGRMEVANDKLYFVASKNGEDQKLYSYMGNGDAPVAELTYPRNFTIVSSVNNQVLFYGYENNGYSKGIWSIAPTPQITARLYYNNNLSGTTAINFTGAVDSAVTYTGAVKNEGLTPLTLSEISVTGAPFYVSGKVNPVLQPGVEQPFKVTLFSSNNDTQKGMLHIRSNSDKDYDLNVQLTGTIEGKARMPNVLMPDDLLKSIQFTESDPLFKLSNNTISETAPINTVIGSFPAVADTKFELVSGPGGEDNGAFKLENSLLKIIKPLDYELKNTYTIRVKGSNSQGSLQKIFIITVTDVQEIPGARSCDTRLASIIQPYNTAAYIGSRLLLVGKEKIMLSDNDGADWRMVPIRLKSVRHSLQVKGPNTAYLFDADYDQPQLFKTENSGDTWFKLKLPDIPGYNFSGIYFSSALTGYLFSNYSYYKTTDGGKTWQINDGRYYLAAFTDDNNGLFAGYMHLTRTTDGGKTVKEITLPATWSSDFTSLTFVSKQVGYLTTSLHEVLQTKDGGNTWAKIGAVESVGSAGNALNFVFVTDQYGLALSGYDPYLTTDGGKTWTEQYLNAGGVSSLAYNLAKMKFCIAGGSTADVYDNPDNHAIYLKSGLAGAWVPLSEIYPSRIYSANFVDPANWYIFGSTNYKTTNGGATWTKIQRPGNSDEDSYRPSTAFATKDVGILINSNGVFRTTNGGATWPKIQVAGVARPKFVSFIDSQTGFFADSIGLLYRTADAGQTWAKNKELNYVSTLQVQFINATTGYLMTGGYTLYKTKDKGLTWASTNTDGFDCFYFFDELNGIASNYNAFERTTDGGITWTKMAIPTLGFLSIKFLDRNHGYGAGNGGIYETKDGGNTWTYLWSREREYENYLSVVGNNVYMTGTNGSMININDPLPIPNAGYIAGETTIPVGMQVAYSVPSTEDTFFKWTVSGPATVTYNNNKINVTWKQAGKYVINVLPLTSCGIGQGRTLDVSVEALPVTRLTGPVSVVRFEKANYSTPDNGNIYNWAIKGDSLHSIKSNVADITWGKKNQGTITVVETHTRFNVKTSANLIVTIKDTTNETTPKINNLVGPKTTNVNPVKVTVYPNPFSGSISINLGDTLPANADVAITRLDGRPFFSKQYSSQGGLINVDLSKYDNGIYILKVNVHGSGSVFKIIKN